MDATLINRQLSRRFNASTSGWSLPADITVQLQHNAGDMVQPADENSEKNPFISHEFIKKAEEILSSCAFGSTLLDSSHEGHVETCIDTQLASPAAYHFLSRTVLVNPNDHEYGNGEAAYVTELASNLCHEHFHAYQQRTAMNLKDGKRPAGVLDDGVVRPALVNPRDFLASTLHMEAAAYTAQLIIAVELNETHPEIEASLADEDLQLWPEMIDAFYDVIASAPDDPAMPEEEAQLYFRKALRAAHDTFWFCRDSEHAMEYAESALEEYNNCLDDTEKFLQESSPQKAAEMAMKLGAERVSEEQMSLLATMPAMQKSYLSIDGFVEAASDRYMHCLPDDIEKELNKLDERIKGLKEQYCPADTHSAPKPGASQKRNNV